MTDQPPAQFKFRLDDDEHDEPPVHEDKKDLRIEKISRRLTLLSFLLPILLIVMIAYGYMDLEKRVSVFHDSGANEVQALGKDVDARFSVLSEKHNALENALNDSSQTDKKAVEELQKQIASIDKRLTDQTKSLTDQIKKGLADTKTAREEVKSTAKELSGSISGIKKELAANTEKIASLPDDFNKEITQINGSISDIHDLLSEYNRSVENVAKQIGTINEKLSALESTVEKNAKEKIGIEAFKKALEEERAIYRQMQSLITGNLEAKMEALRKEVQQMMMKVKETTREAQSKQSSAPPAKATTSPPAKPGKILEQNIQ